MPLLGFKVHKYRNVEGWEIERLGRLTCIVGMNECGKSNLLRALQTLDGSRQHQASHVRDFPRLESAPSQGDDILIEGRFRLEGAFQTSALSLSPLRSGEPPSEILVRRHFSGALEYQIGEHRLSAASAQSRRSTQDLSRHLPDIPGDVRGPYFREYHQLLTLLRSLPDEQRNSELASRLSSTMKGLDDRIGRVKNSLNVPEKAFYNHLKEVFSTVRREIDDNRTKTNDSLQAIGRHHGIILLDSYSPLRASHSLREFADPSTPNHSATDRIMLSTLLSWGGAGPRDLLLTPSEAPVQRRVRLDSIERAINSRLKGKNPIDPFRISISVDDDDVSIFVASEDDPHFRVPVSERSLGFQWRLAFDLILESVLENNNEVACILLDEPGNHLHPSAQAKLLARLRSLSEAVPIVYSTHLPGLVDLDDPLSVWTAQRSGNGVRLARGFGTRSNDSPLALQRALGLVGRYSMVFARENLVVEGWTDWLYISAICSNDDFDYDEFSFDTKQVTLASGASSAVTITRLLQGQGVGVVVVLDGDQSGVAAAKGLRQTEDRTLDSPGRVETITLNDLFDEVRNPTIEDVMTRDVFFSIVSSVSNGLSVEDRDRMLDAARSIQNIRSNLEVLEELIKKAPELFGGSVQVGEIKTDVAEFYARNYSATSVVAKDRPVLFDEDSVSRGRKLRQELRKAFSRIVVTDNGHHG